MTDIIEEFATVADALSERVYAAGNALADAHGQAMKAIAEYEAAHRERETAMKELIAQDEADRAALAEAIKKANDVARRIVGEE